MTGPDIVDAPENGRALRWSEEASPGHEGAPPTPGVCIISPPLSLLLPARAPVFSPVLPLFKGEPGDEAGGDWTGGCSRCGWETRRPPTITPPPPPLPPGSLGKRPTPVGEGRSSSQKGEGRPVDPPPDTRGNVERIPPPPPPNEVLPNEEPARFSLCTPPPPGDPLPAFAAETSAASTPAAAGELGLRSANDGWRVC